MGPVPLVFCTPPRKERSPSPPEELGLVESTPQQIPRAPRTHAFASERPHEACHRVSRKKASGRLRLQLPFSHRPPKVPGAGRMGAADRPGRLPAPVAAASAPGLRRRRLERVAGPGGGAAGALETPTRGNPARGLCMLSNYLFIEKRGGREKKEVTCPGYTYAKRSSRRREKLRRAGEGGREAAAEAAAAQEAAAAARPGTDTHLYECAYGS